MVTHRLPSVNPRRRHKTLEIKLLFYLSQRNNVLNCTLTTEISVYCQHCIIYTSVKKGTDTVVSLFGMKAYGGVVV
jgi:hypothetical protein